MASRIDMHLVSVLYRLSTGIILFSHIKPPCQEKLSTAQRHNKNHHQGSIGLVVMHL